MWPEYVELFVLNKFFPTETRAAAQKVAKQLKGENDGAKTAANHLETYFASTMNPIYFNGGRKFEGDDGEPHGTRLDYLISAYCGKS